MAVQSAELDHGARDSAAATGSFRRYPDGDSLIGWGFMSGADFGLAGNAGFTEVDQSG